MPSPTETLNDRLLRLAILHHESIVKSDYLAARKYADQYATLLDTIIGQRIAESLRAFRNT